MNAEEIQTMLLEAIETAREANDCTDALFKRVSTFEEALVLTRDKGLVLKMHDGTEFQVSIVRSK